MFNTLESRTKPIEGPAIIIAGAGMCDAGPVQRHLRDHLRDPRATVLFTGYCGSSTLGGKLQAFGKLDPKERPRDRSPIEVDGETFQAREIKATIDRISGYSAHADQAGLLDWLWSGKQGEPKRCIGAEIFVTHGDMQQRTELKAAIMAKAAAHGEEVTVQIPRETGDWHILA
jgi:metallo-beta-lactamase family protein